MVFKENIRALESVPVYIYGLCDPDTMQVRYVGQTLNTRMRLYAHMCPSRRKTGPRAEWINSLASAGKKPVMTVLEVANGLTWSSREQHWISHYQASLTNQTAGGEGMVNPVPETRARLAASISRGRTGMKFTQEHKDALSKRKREYFSDLKNREGLSRHWAKLTDEQVLEVFQLAVDAEITQAEIAKRYGMSTGTVSDIKHGNRYKHVPCPCGTHLLTKREKAAIELHEQGMSNFRISKAVGFDHHSTAYVLATAKEKLKNGGY